MLPATALLVTADDYLLDDVLRLTAAAGVTLDVAHDTGSAASSWATAPVVLVGADQAAALAERHPARREQVHVVSHAPAPDDLFRAALALGAQHVAELPAAETWLVELLTDVGDGGSSAAVTIGVVGGSGGSGATIFSAALGQAAASAGRQALLVDADPLGGGIDRVLGYDSVEGIRWDAFSETTGRFSSRSLREALPHRDALAVLTWPAGDNRPLEPFAVREVLSAAQRGNDVVVVDLPRHLDAAGIEVLGRCDHVVVVAGLGVPAFTATRRVVGCLRQHARHLHLVTRGKDTALVPEELARMLDLPLLAAMGDQRRLEESIDLGLGPTRSRRGPLLRAARAVLTQLLEDTRRAA